MMMMTMMMMMMMIMMIMIMMIMMMMKMMMMMIMMIMIMMIMMMMKANLVSATTSVSRLTERAATYERQQERMKRHKRICEAKARDRPEFWDTIGQLVSRLYFQIVLLFFYVLQSS